MSRSYKKTGAYSYSNHGDKWCRNQYHRAERRKTKLLLHEVGLDDVIETIEEKEICMLCMDGFYCEVTNFGKCDIPYRKYMDEEYQPDWNECSYHRCYSRCSSATDKIISGKGSCIDYSIKWSDKWSWASDGGAWWREDKLHIRKNFDKEVFTERNYYRSRFDKTPLRTIWDDYLGYVEKKHNEEHPKLRIYLKRVIGIKKYYSWITRRYEDTYEYERTSFEVPCNKAHKFDSNLIPKGWDIKKHFSSYYKVDGYGWQGDSKWDEIYFGMIPLDLKTPQELIEWLRKNQERMVNSIWKRRYSK